MAKAIAVIIFLLAIGSGAIVAAQGTSQPRQVHRELHGEVVDQTGAVIPGASLLLDDRLGHSYTARTDEQGQYRLSGVVPGTYKLTATADGFTSFSTDVILNSAPTALLNIKLQVSITEEVEIKASDIGISAEPDRNISSITLSEEELEALPDDPDELLGTLRNLAGASGDAALYVDGFSEEERVPSKESIQAVRINNTPFTAEFAESGGSRIEIITKPGSEKLRGSFRLNFNDESLNARNPFATTRAPLQIRNFSGTISGPIKRNRWGYFVDVEHHQREENDVVNARVLAPETLQPQSFITTIQTPSRSTELTFRTKYLLTEQHTVGAQFSFEDEASRNQGLGSGFDLPERAFDETSRETEGRFTLTSILSARAINELRFRFARQVSTAQALNQAPAIVVLDAFSSGGNQSALFRDVKRDRIELRNAFSFSTEDHAFKIGFDADGRYRQNVSQANFGGTYTFGSDVGRDANGNPLLDADGRMTVISSLERYRRTLLGLPGYTPSQFSITRGEPSLDFSQWEFAWYAQDDWRISPRLTLSYGLRHDFQTHLSDKLNFSPRVAMAWVPDKERKSAFRAGAGIFHTSVDEDITFDTLRLNGQSQQQYIVSQPAFTFDIDEALNRATLRRPTIRTKSDDLSAPYTMLSNVSYERQLPWKLFGSVGYTWRRSVHLLRTRNINAPYPAAPGLRPFPEKGTILQFESSGIAVRHELKVALRSKVSRTFTLFTNYTLSSARGNTDGASTSPANPYDLSNEFGRLSSDQRHRFFAGSSLSLPWGLRASPFLEASSGRPFNITTGFDNNGDLIFTDRPAFADPDDREAVLTPYGPFYLNPRSGATIIPRNLGTGPGQFTLNTRFSKVFRFGAPEQSNNRRARRDAAASRGRYNLTLDVDVRNLTNRANLAGYNGVLTSPLFGRANRALGARRIQLGLRFSF